MCYFQLNFDQSWNSATNPKGFSTAYLHPKSFVFMTHKEKSLSSPAFGSWDEWLLPLFTDNRNSEQCLQLLAALAAPSQLCTTRNLLRSPGNCSQFRWKNVQLLEEARVCVLCRKENCALRARQSKDKVWPLYLHICFTSHSKGDLLLKLQVTDLHFEECEGTAVLPGATAG